MGQNFRAFVGGAAVTEATNCQVTIQGNVEDATRTPLVAERGDDLEAVGVQVDNDASLANLRALITRFNSDTRQTGWGQQRR